MGMWQLKVVNPRERKELEIKGKEKGENKRIKEEEKMVIYVINVIFICFWVFMRL